MLARFLTAALVSSLAFIQPARAQTAEIPERYRAYYDSMSAHGMTPLIPATSDFGPGYIYRMIRVGRGRDAHEAPRTVCSNAFDTPPREIETRLPSTHRVSDHGFSLGLSVLPGAVADGLSASLGGQLANVRTVDMAFGEMRDYEIAETTGLDTDDVLVDRVINRACARNLERLPRRNNGRFRDKVFLVIRATAPRSFRYTLAGEGGASINLSAEMAETGTVNAGWRTRRVNGQSFEVTRDTSDSSARPIYISALTVQLTNATELATVSNGRRTRFRGRPANAEDSYLSWPCLQEYAAAVTEGRAVDRHRCMASDSVHPTPAATPETTTPHQ